MNCGVLLCITKCELIVTQCWASGTQVLPEGVGQVGTHPNQPCLGRYSAFSQVLEYSWVVPRFWSDSLLF
jgi:hypothetical protein